MFLEVAGQACIQSSLSVIGQLQKLNNKLNLVLLHSKITMAGDVVPYYTVTVLVPTLK